SEQGEAGAGLAAEGQLPRTHRDDGEGRRGGRPLFALGPSAERVADMSARPVTVVLGARGTLGSALGPVLERAGWDVAAAVASGECDITDGAAVRALFGRTRPAAVFNAAAYNDAGRAGGGP